MGTTQNYGYNVPVGSDNVNLLPQMAANFPMIDSDLKAVSNAAIGSATELVTGTVHALTRADANRNVFVFVATSNFEAGETFEVDGTQVTAKTPDGQNLSTGAYVINSGVLCVLNGTLLTVFVNPTKALDADKLDGHDSSYFAKDSDLTTLSGVVSAVSTKVGSGALDVGSDCVDGINKLYENASKSVADVNLPNSWSVSDDGKAHFIKVGGLVIISFYHLNILQIGSVSNLFTIPAGFRPSGTQYVTLTEIPTSGNRSITLELMANGTVNAITRGSVGEPNFTGVKGVYVL